jgi:iron complex outermembrane recepter protein
MHCYSHYRHFAVLCIILLPAMVLAQKTSLDSPSASIAELKKLDMGALMDIEVTSVSKKAEKLSDAASAIQVITHDDIRRSGAANLPEALRLATNLQVAQVNSSQWAISARGFNNVLANKLLVMIDGRTVYTPLYAGVFWDVQNVLLDDIDRIEVISGPGGTLWGANAVNGVINIITKNAKNSQGLLVEAAAGTELRGLGNIRYGGQIGKQVYFKAYGTAFKRDNTINLDESDANDAWTMAQGGFEFDWDATEKDAVTLQSNLYDNRPNPDGTEALVARGHNVMSRWTHSQSENSDFQLQVYYDQTWRDFQNGFTEKLRTYDVDWQHRFSLGKSHEIIWGLGYRLMDHEVENTELLKFEPAHKHLHLYNIFVQDQFSIIKDRLLLTVGSKFEHNSFTGLQIQPNGRLALSILQDHTLWVSVSRAVRTPARIDRDFRLSTSPEIDLVIGNDEFKSEKVLAYELGWRFQSPSQFNLSLATFYNIYDYLRTAEPGPPPLNLPITIGNGLEGETYGAEISGTYQPLEWWRIRGGYTFIKKELSLKPASKDLNEGNAESNDPEHQFLIQSTMNLPSNIEWGFVVRHISELPDPRVASYWGLDSRVSWMPTKTIEISLVGQNLLNDRHVEFARSSPTTRSMERGLYGKVGFRF